MQSIKIGNHEWLKSNLNVETFRNGDAIPEAKSPGAWQIAAENAMPAWCYFNNDIANASLGKLYNWYAVNDPRGLAPKGWHIPRDRDWTMLFLYLGFNIDSVLKRELLRNVNVEEKHSENFISLKQPNGFRDSEGAFTQQGAKLNWWWSTTHFDSNKAIIRGIDTSCNETLKMYWDKGVGLFVCCVREIQEQ